MMMHSAVISLRPLFLKHQKTLQKKNSWATVTCNGHKKSRLAITVIIARTKKFSEINPDDRLFVRLPLDNEWRNPSPAGLREVIVEQLVVFPALIRLIKPVRTGFVISPCSSGAREALFRTIFGLRDTGAKLEPASNWVPLVGPTVPKFIRTIQGQTKVTKEILASEIERVTSIRPTSVRYYGTSNAEAPHRTWMAYFDKSPRPSFRVFDESGRVILFKNKEGN
ncbi:hypothetical protein EPUL_004167 [Erysiphe pulchra]|uniref:Uncharacterized protein n=1 Tax=Erysiphe pulchra TaxID=225359 RepID=A0A2S4PVD5_9PEZI|nr:hypothetical protein EPUL_004167 [Erysiphe pulchra]